MCDAQSATVLSSGFGILQGFSSKAEAFTRQEGEKMREIYYMIAYDPDKKRWMAADAMLQQLNNGSGQVLEGDGIEGKWRHIQEGLETDVDYDNTELLTEFLRQANGS